jgi:hypothetical protein
MATLIRFNDNEFNLKVEQGADDVSSAWDRAGGKPFALNFHSNGEVVWVNPTTITCWYEFEERVSPGRMVQDLGSRFLDP